MAGTIHVHNRGNGAVITSKGRLNPGKSQELPEAEAKALIGSRGIVNAASIVNSEPVQAENAKIRKDIEELKAQKEALEAEKAELIQAVAELDGEGKELEKQVKALQKKLSK